MNKNKQKWISDKISKLIKGGKSKEAAIAQSYSMYNQMLKGGTYSDKGMPKYQEGVGSTQGYSYDDYLNKLEAGVGNIGYSYDNYLNELEQGITKQLNPTTTGAPTSQVEVGYQIPEGWKPPTDQELDEFDFQEKQQENIDFVQGKPDPNAFYAQQANWTTSNFEQQQKKQDAKKQQMFNPFGSIGLEQSLAYAGQGFGEKDPSKAALGTGLSLLKGARTFMSGMGIGREERRMVTEYAQNMQEEEQYLMRKKGGYSSYKQGGKITNGEQMTGEFLTENLPEANVELEDGEYTENSQTGEIQETVGEKHDDGGVKTNLPDKSKVISDYTKIGGKNSRMFKDEFDIKVRATDTFATVLDKYNKKIGLDTLIKEEEEIFKKIEKQESSADIKENVKVLNMTALQKRLEDITEEKSEIKTQQKEAFDKIFEAQEEIPKKKEKQEMKEGGIMNEDFEYLAKKYKVDKNKIMDLIEMREGGYTNRTRLKDWLAEARGKGFEEEFDLDAEDMGAEVGKLQKFYAEKFPNEIVKYFQNQPITAKGIKQLQKSNPELFEKAGVPKTKSPANYTPEERLKVQNLYRETNPEDTQFFLDQFQDNTWNVDNSDTWRSPLMAVDSGNKASSASITPEGQIAKSVEGFTPTNQGMFYTGTEGETKIEPREDVVTEGQKRARSGSNIPMIPQDFMLPPDARREVYKQQVQLGRIDPMKTSAEPALVEVERQRQAMEQALQFLPPAQRAAAMANALGQTQEASNKAIGQTELTNAQGQYQADQFNLQAQAKEDLLNTRFNQDYENKTMSAITNQQRDVRQYFNDLNDAQRFNFEYVDRRNLLNQATPNYNVSGASNVEFAGGSDFLKNFLNTSKEMDFENMNPQQREAYMDMFVKSQKR